MGSLVRSDRQVYATASIRPSGPCQPSAALAGPTFSYLRNPNPHVSGGFHDFTDASTQGWGAHMGDSQISGLGTPEVDMFATVSNSHLPRFMSPIPEPRALAVDALSQDWQGRSVYMFPQFPAQQSHSEA